MVGVQGWSEASRSCWYLDPQLGFRRSEVTYLTHFRRLLGVTGPLDAPQSASRPNPRTRNGPRGMIITLVAVIFLLALVGSAIFFLYRSAQTTLDGARADVDRFQPVVAAAVQEGERAQAGLEVLTK